MAKQNDPTPLSEEHVDSVIYHAGAKEALRFGIASRDFEEDGGMRTDREADNVELACGTVVNSVLLMRTPGALKVCDLCREESQRRWRPSSRKIYYALASNVTTCSCGKTACSRHAVVSKVDGQVRCRACDRRASRQHLLRRIRRVLFYRNA